MKATQNAGGQRAAASLASDRLAAFRRSFGLFHPDVDMEGMRSALNYIID